MDTSMNFSRGLKTELIQPYDFEMSQDLRPFLEEYWVSSFFIVLVYLLLIIFGQNYMKTRKGFSLQRPLILWSFCLAIFSILGTLRMWKFMGTVLFTMGLKQTVCFTDYTNDAIVKFWSWVFLLSKVVELGDTAFIILRKRPLIFVHWYHHSTVLLFTSFGYKNKVPSGGWFMTMNLGVHSVMYTYYTMKAAKVKHPNILPMVITSLQILQMVLGTIFGILNYIWRQERGCYTTSEHFFWSFVLYGTYFILFAQFFHRAYLRPKRKAESKSQ
ncbi:elongation of very long chain fatty acids (FEN1/Elo2, SUR4/Elo3, yeast)-like 3 (predicted) [Rattus norvegicus]|uniref:Elongation of very long chain fatty acids protein 3 n=2 Tax=Rattus norvegicus TaxID=10116 RepID=D3ZPX9_RAT|nr:elongation of very long chain fatty acids protein 3 [Rattus norvegicus]EDL94335.1 elongation of very long chain fatty acids (FEN1/Elo2, SUR4/Elo3, yeast)-like 3 (predicted) [Rattus norvegicus]|eukprot:NP_001101072.1 elongation of very long chain fatty acids protein 3 [Rattus norvegicus]